jgi:hypothetical protein
MLKEKEAHRAWTTKFNPWLIDEYRQVRDFWFSLKKENIY